MPAAAPNNPVHCGRCGHRYQQDPPFEVDCPECGAKAGQYCKRPSGHQGPFVPFHAKRDLLAKEKGYYEHTCASKPTEDKTHPSQLKLGF
jgi:predicted  nucleic acid-binding Zn-ribbon protein